MRVLVLGSGAREHALAWKFSRSNRISGLFTAPGNVGCQEVGKILNLDPNDGQAVLNACREHKIDLVFVGSEAPLEAGIVDILSSQGKRVIGPSKSSARLESSKVFSKEFMNRHSIPTAASEHFTQKEAFLKYCDSQAGKMLVVKKSGLAAGKGVLESSDTETLKAFGSQILANDELLVEEYLQGFEVSVFVLSDGKNYKILPACADFKKAGEGDLGPNTGGMAAICPVPTVSRETWSQICEQLVDPTMEGLNKDGINYKGVLFFGVMVTEQGPKLLEYNVRFGDPEAQVLIPLIRSDFVDLMEAIWEERLDQYPLEVSQENAVCVVVASGGYPKTAAPSAVVTGLPENSHDRFFLYHASTIRDESGATSTNGGRCFSCVGIGESFSQARGRAYRGAQNVLFEGAWFRKDIGEKFFLEKA